ncbi:hypothetical protein AB1K83_10460 [Sporosarcina sp. 179-K 3D1 HS]|uniref:hypothetical protein n=1 Tax=Sporosarcina sp. 179-K 3D1 HS TaxID=3232169 RepID=UPI00399F8598
MSLIAWTIVACEIGFWVVILLGLLIRYVFNRKKIGLFFLALTPVIDLILLAITAMDLSNGAAATQIHALAAIYLGVSIAFGKSMIRWADERFLYYVKKQGNKPKRKTGWEHARHSLKGSFQHLAAFLIGAALLLLMIFLIGNPYKTSALSGTLKTWLFVLGVDFAISISYFIWPRAEKVRKGLSE